MDLERRILSEVEAVHHELKDIPQRTIGDYFASCTPDEQQADALRRWKSVKIHDFALKIVTEGLTHEFEVDVECLQTLQREEGNLLFAVVDIYNVAAVRVERPCRGCRRS